MTERIRLLNGGILEFDEPAWRGIEASGPAGRRLQRLRVLEHADGRKLVLGSVQVGATATPKICGILVEQGRVHDALLRMADVLDIDALLVDWCLKGIEGQSGPADGK